jgi:O-acetyl-ADP-ribose deacetylase (regulator of RNase III)/uncharacterized protein YwgA
MMVKVLEGNLFESKAQTLVNTVNCVGIMGKGIALEFKNRFPDMFKDYADRCKRGEVKLGQPYLYKTLLLPWILNFPTKDHWRSVTNLKDIVQGLEYLLKHYKEWGITSIAVPPLGCGHGQLEWRIVGPTLHSYLSKMDIPVEIYAPYGTPHEELQREFFGQATTGTPNQHAMPSPQWVKPAWVALVEILRRIEEQPYHWSVGRTTFQKIAYVVTEEGLPTELKYRKSSFGPFASELKGLEARLLNNGLIRVDRYGNMFRINVGPTFLDAKKAYADDLSKWESIIDKTADLFMRINTNQAEIIATALFAARAIREAGNERPTERDVLDYVMQWKHRRRPPLDEVDVALTIRNLAALSWLTVSASKDLPLPEEVFADAC